MGKVDPCVDDYEGEGVLEEGNENFDGEFCQAEFEGGRVVVVGVGGEGVTTADKLGELGACAQGCSAELFCVDAECVEKHGDDISGILDCESCVVDFAGFITNQCWPVTVIEEKTNGDLHKVIPYDCLEAFPSCNVISLEFLFGRVDSMVAKDFVAIEEMKECSGDGIDYCWQDDGQHIITYPW